MKRNSVVFDDLQNNTSSSQIKISPNKNILIIILDEYSSKEELKPYINDSIKLNEFSNCLDSLGFLVLNNQLTKDTLTFNSISGVLNYDRLGYLNDKSEQAALMNLKRASVINRYEEAGYVFKNFSFLNISNHKEFYYWYPYPRNQIEFLFKNSMLPHIVPFFNINYINTFEQFTISSDYNKKVYHESLKYINGLNGKKGYITYVHFLLPHSPYYIKDEFPHVPTTFKSYVEYWKYTNKVIIQYIKSIQNLENYKVIITGDHGYRTNKLVNPYHTMSAFYNFDQLKRNDVNTVQDIGRILITTLK